MAQTEHEGATAKFTEVVKAVENMLATVGLSNRKMEIQDDFDQDQNGNNLPAAHLEDFSIGVCTLLEDEPTTGERLGFTIQRTYTIPGKAYMPNGDPGYPDEVDIADVATFDLADWSDAAVRFVTVFVETALEIAVENWAEMEKGMADVDGA